MVCEIKMKDDLYIKNFYKKDEYITKNPSLHEEDSSWKIKKIIPLVDKFCCETKQDEINLLDVGGGAGLIINSISNYIQKNYGIKVNKFLLDLSPGMLENQKKVNPDYKLALQEDIQNTSLNNMQIDLTLMIDVLEHVSDPISTLKELKRISKFVIFKVPLEDNLFENTCNFFTFGRIRRNKIELAGHINVYNFDKLKSQIENNGQILDYCFTNASEWFSKDHHQRRNRRTLFKLKDLIAANVFRLSPKYCSYIFFDFVNILVKSY